MKKYLLILICALVVFAVVSFAFSQPSFGFGAQTITNNNASTKIVYKSTFDNLVFDFTLKVAKPDILKALTLKNIGDATFLDNILELNLWVDNGPAGFQGTDVDKKIGSLSYLNAYDTWYVDNLAVTVSGSVRFFVTVDSYAVMYKVATTQMQIPVYKDVNGSKTFDFGDQGLFFASGSNGPEDAPVTNKYQQTFSRLEKDILGPRIYFTNIFDKDTINTPNFEFKIFAKEQGNNKVLDLKMYINSQEFPITRFVDDNHWIFDWDNIVDDDYTIMLEANDSWDNITKFGPINIKVRKAYVAFENSKALIDKDTLLADGLEYATVKLTLIDYFKKFVPDREISLVASPNLVITKFNKKTNKSGENNFEVRSAYPGIKKLTVLVDEQPLQTFVLNFVTPPMIANKLNFGDLIKGVTPKAVYYLGADDKRYVFPSEQVFFSWYPDFKSVKVVPDDVLAQIGLGGNVTYKPASKLIKIQSSPKVYAVDKNGILRWISSEEVAVALYGPAWVKTVEDVSDAFWSNYSEGVPITLWKDFDVNTLTATITGINVDKGLYK